MAKLKERIKDWEYNVFYDYEDEVEIKPLIITFSLIVFVPSLLFIILSAIIYNSTIDFNDCLYFVLGIPILFFICCIPGVILSFVCTFIICIFKIGPLKSILITLLSALVGLGCYSLYRMYWPVGSEQVLLENFTSESQNCEIVVVHKERCKYFRGGFQKKEEFQKYIKGKNYMYCECVGIRDVDLLDAISNKNRSELGDKIISDFENSRGSFDIDGEFYRLDEWFDDTYRDYTIYYGYDPNKREFKKINPDVIAKEYYQK